MSEVSWHDTSSTVDHRVPSGKANRKAVCGKPARWIKFESEPKLHAE